MLSTERQGNKRSTFFADKLAEAYDRLRQLVMDYLGMSEAADQVGGANQQMPLSTTMHKDETSDWNYIYFYV